MVCSNTIPCAGLVHEGVLIKQSESVWHVLSHGDIVVNLSVVDLFDSVLAVKPPLPQLRGIGLDSSGQIPRDVVDRSERNIARHNEPLEIDSHDHGREGLVRVVVGCQPIEIFCHVQWAGSFYGKVVDTARDVWMENVWQDAGLDDVVVDAINGEVVHCLDGVQVRHFLGLSEITVRLTQM